MANQALEAMASALEASGNYRVLRRPDLARACAAHPDGLLVGTACIVDVETTGLDAARDEIIQLAIQPFRYSIGEDPHVVEALPDFCRYRQPTRPIGRTITKLTGIDDAMVTGQSIAPHEVESFLAQYAIDFVVAHNAKFDREFLVRAFPDAFAARRWHCSLSQVPWESEAFRGRGLAFLAMEAGWFCRSHDAGEDCHAVLALLNHTLPVSGRTALSHLLSKGAAIPPMSIEQARMPTMRIRAMGAPFERKDTLKARGYRWCSGATGEPKAWYIDVVEGQLAAEVAYLEGDILGKGGRVIVEPVGA